MGGSIRAINDSLGEMGVGRPVAIVVEQHMEFHPALGTGVVSPGKQPQTQGDRGTVQAQQLVAEPEAMTRRLPATLVQELIEDILIQLPWALAVRIGESRPGAQIRVCKPNPASADHPSSNR